MATVRWECVHKSTLAHWEMTSGSRADFCQPVSEELDEWCPKDQGPVEDCGCDPTGLWRRRDHASAF